MQDTIVSWLKEALKETGIDQKTLAQALGISATQISRMVTGDREVKLSELGHVSRYLKAKLPPRLLHDLNAYEALRVPVIGIIQPGEWLEYGRSYTGDVYVPFVYRNDLIPAEPFLEIQQVAYRLDAKFLAQPLNCREYIVCVPYDQVRPLYTNRDIIIGRSHRGRQFQMGLWEIVQRWEGPGQATRFYARNFYADALGDTLLPLDNNPDFEVVDMVVGLFAVVN